LWGDKKLLRREKINKIPVAFMRRTPYNEAAKVCYKIDKILKRCLFLEGVLKYEKL
jgi:hypothetical protein